MKREEKMRQLEPKNPDQPHCEGCPREYELTPGVRNLKYAVYVMKAKSVAQKNLAHALAILSSCASIFQTYPKGFPLFLEESTTLPPFS